MAVDDIILLDNLNKLELDIETVYHKHLEWGFNEKGGKYITTALLTVSNGIWYVASAKKFINNYSNIGINR